MGEKQDTPVMGNQILRGATDLDTLKGMIRAAREHPQEVSK